MTADVVYTGGDIVTVDDAQPSAEAVAVKDGKIVAVGDRESVQGLAGIPDHLAEQRASTASSVP